MRSSQLEIFNAMPFLYWAKDEDGRYIWGNRAINDFAKESVVGKTDDELPWADSDSPPFHDGPGPGAQRSMPSASRGTGSPGKSPEQ